MKLNLQQVQSLVPESSEHVSLKDYLNSIEEKIDSVEGGGLPSTDPSQEYYYLMVDGEGNIVAHQPVDGVGDCCFYYNDGNELPSAAGVEELCEAYYNEITQGWFGAQVNELRERLNECIDYEIIQGDSAHLQSDTSNHNIILTSFTFTGVNKVDVIKIIEHNSGNSDLIGINFLNMDDYRTLRVNPNLDLTINNAARTEWDIEYGTGYYYTDEPAIDLEIIPFELRKKIPITSNTGYDILEAYHMEDW